MNQRYSIKLFCSDAIATTKRLIPPKTNSWWSFRDGSKRRSTSPMLIVSLRISPKRAELSDPDLPDSGFEQRQLWIRLNGCVAFADVDRP